MTTLTGAALTAVYLDVFQNDYINGVLIVFSVLTGGLTVNDANKVIKENRSKKNDL